MKAHPEWGGLKGFACAGCEQEVRTFGGIVSPAGLVGVGGLAVCKPCAERMERQPVFREAVTVKAAQLTRRALVQRIADALDVSPMAVGVAWASAQGNEGLDRHMDAALGLKPGQFDAALEFAVGSVTS